MNSVDVMKMAQTKSLVLLAGPCVVEGEDLVMEVAGRVKEIADKLNLRESRVNEHIRHLRTDKKHENLNVVIDGNGIVKIERME